VTCTFASCRCQAQQVCGVLVACLRYGCTGGCRLRCCITRASDCVYGRCRVTCFRLSGAALPDYSSRQLPTGTFVCNKLVHTCSAVALQSASYSKRCAASLHCTLLPYMLGQHLASMQQGVELLPVLCRVVLCRL
jgi:hypothetical protein